MKIDRRIQRSQRTRKKLLEAAKKVFLNVGYHDATIKMINAEAGTGHGTIYAHFPEGKEDILRFLVREVMDEFYAITDIEFKPKSVEEAYEIIYDQVLQFVSLAEQHKHILAVFYEAIGSSESMRKLWEEFLDNFLARITMDIQYAIDSKLAKTELDSEIVARILLSSGERFLWEIVRGQNKKSIKEIAANITKVYMFGLYK